MRDKIKSIVGPKKLTRYELARVIGARALQIALGAPVLIKIPPGITDPIDIAMLELKRGILPIIIRRRLPNNEYQDIPVSTLLSSSEE
ncbi:MAG: DNA-directed RNA polymerase subunit K [Thermoprotei archaeon]|nr:MAG: DNA-directed RNA polymerase subunit K [Thermoprotei archaeon]